MMQLESHTPSVHELIARFNLKVVVDECRNATPQLDEACLPSTGLVASHVELFRELGRRTTKSPPPKRHWAPHTTASPLSDCSTPKLFASAPGPSTTGLSLSPLRPSTSPSPMDLVGTPRHSADLLLETVCSALGDANVESDVVDMPGSPLPKAPLQSPKVKRKRQDEDTPRGQRKAQKTELGTPMEHLSTPRSTKKGRNKENVVPDGQPQALVLRLREACSMVPVPHTPARHAPPPLRKGLRSCPRASLVTPQRPTLLRMAATAQKPKEQGKEPDDSQRNSECSSCQGSHRGPYVSEFIYDQLAKLKSANNLLREENQKLRSGEEALQQELAKAKATDANVEKLRKQTSKAKEDLEHYRHLYEHATHTLDNTKLELEQQMETVNSLNRQIATLQDMLGMKETQIVQMGVVISEGEMVRRKLHNFIQELKGNIRVYCRVRPVLPSENSHTAGSIRCVGADGNALELRAAGFPDGAVDLQPDHCFKFDRVFAAGANNAQVFQDISQLVQSALDGYRVCIFAYGQTGSGKTYTMEGQHGCNVSHDACGMIPRAVMQIFSRAQELEAQGWTFSLSAQFLEIYNEQLRDLLGDVPALSRQSGAGCPPKVPPPKHEIKHDPTGRKPTTVTGVSVVPVSDVAAVNELLARAIKNRAFAATNANDHSSRSHSVFSLFISGRNRASRVQTHGILNMIDLAGSERLQHSGAVGDRLKETQHINKSLSCLGDVIHALSQKAAHIPFRNSKLTYLLQSSLGGDCKTLMFVNVSPNPEHAGETLCSLRFAAKANSCEIGAARRNVLLKE